MRANHSTPRRGPRMGAARVSPRRPMPSSRPIDDDVDKIVRRYRAEILEHEPVAELLVQPAHGVVDLDPVPPVDQKGGVCHHALAHDLGRSCLVDERSDATENDLLVARAFLRQGVLHLRAEADALVVGFRRRTPVERIAHPTNVSLSRTTSAIAAPLYQNALRPSSIRSRICSSSSVSSW